jgi:LPS export ABC transporter protein LptC
MIRLSNFIMILVVFGLLFPAGCENDIERVGMLTGNTDIPRVQGTNIEVIYSDSGRVKVQIISNAFREFNQVARPYMEFPEGLQVYFYNDSMHIESDIKADYTIYYPDERLWHATGNVVARRLDNGDALNTEELFWDEAKKLIYSEAFTRVQNEDGTFYGKNGFESHQDLSNWKLKGSSGTVNVQDEE